MQAAPPFANFTIIPNAALDEWLTMLPFRQLSVMLLLARETIGREKPSVTMTNKEIATRIGARGGIGVLEVDEAIEILNRRRYLRILSMETPGGINPIPPTITYALALKPNGQDAADA